MDKLKQKIQLLALFSIFFIYKCITSLAENNLEEMSLWFMFTLVYLITLVIAFFALRRSPTTPINPKVLIKKEEKNNSK